MEAEEAEGVVNTGASTSVGKCLTCKLGIWKRSRKVMVQQGYGSCMRGKFIVNTSFKTMDFSAVLSEFAIDIETLDIWNMDTNV